MATVHALRKPTTNRSSDGSGAQPRRTLQACSPGGKLAELEAARERLSEASTNAHRRHAAAMAAIHAAVGDRKFESRAALAAFLRGATPAPTAAEKTMACLGIGPAHEQPKDWFAELD